MHAREAAGQHVRGAGGQVHPHAHGVGAGVGSRQHGDRDGFDRAPAGGQLDAGAQRAAAELGQALGREVDHGAHLRGVIDGEQVAPGLGHLAGFDVAGKLAGLDEGAGQVVEPDLLAGGAGGLDRIHGVAGV